MLCLVINKGESVYIGESVVKVVKVGRDKIRLEIMAPKNVVILREKLIQDIGRSKK